MAVPSSTKFGASGHGSCSICCLEYCIVKKNCRRFRSFRPKTLFAIVTFEPGGRRVSRQSHVRQAQADSVEHRAERAQVFSRLGELYSARQALGGSCVAPGNLATLDSLTNKDRRPPRQRDPLPQSATDNQAAFPLHPESFLRNVRCAQKGLRRLFDMTALVPTAVSPIVTLSTTLTFHNVNHKPVNPRNPKSQTPNPRPQTKRKTTLGLEPRFFCATSLAR